MTTTTIRCCDQCGTTIPDGARSFSLNIELTVWNGHKRSNARDYDAICSEKCLHDALTALTRDTERC